MENTRLELKETAKAIRGELKAAFPGAKFSVRTHRASTCSAVDVLYPMTMTADQIAKVCEICAKYQGISFDGMDDSTNYQRKEVTFEGVKRLAGCAWVQCQRDYQPEAVAA